MHWTYHADLGKYFTGFFSEKDVYEIKEMMKAVLNHIENKGK